MHNDDEDSEREWWCGWWREFVRTLLLWALALGTLSVVACSCFGQGGPSARYATVQIESHGGSGTVIATGVGRSLVLSAAHMFAPRDRSRPIRIQAPSPAPGSPVRAGPRCVAVDQAADLALIELGAGPLPYCCPVAPAGHQTSRMCLSVGYDQMHRPPQMRPATLLRVQGSSTYTREMPFHGRSGGALIDEQAGGLLVGVVSAYTGGQRRSPDPDTVPGREGVYASHGAILAFLRRNGHEPDGTGRLESGRVPQLPDVQPPDLFSPQLPPRSQRQFPVRPAQPFCPT